MEQSREEMHEKIMKASDRKILRRQMELLAEYSRTCGIERTPESSEAMTSIYKQLLKAECILFVRILIAFFGFLYLQKKMKEARGVRR